MSGTGGEGEAMATRAFATELRQVTDEQRRRDAVEARRREQWLRRQSGEEGTLAGVLVDLAERALPCVFTTVGGRTPRGVVRTLGRDHVGLCSVTGERALVVLAAVTSVRPEPGAPPTAGDRFRETGTTLGDVLGELAAERPRITVHTVDGRGTAGALHQVGRDVVVVWTGSDGHVYVPSGAIADVTLG